MRSKKRKQPKYYLRASFNYDDWFAICQSLNNVMVCEVTDENIARLVLDFLNALPGSVTRHVKVSDE